jgi:ABC-type branched-subunit amino acid transport system ATPase component/ABC-type branched-subunit amino acid transport system permease subunit
VSGLSYYIVVLLVYLGSDLLATWGLNLEFGVAGVANFAYIVLVAAGAYVYSILTLGPSSAGGGFQSYIIGLHLPAAAAILIAMAVAAALGCLVGVTGLRRLRPDYQAMVTLVISLMAITVVSADTGLVNGNAGLSGIPNPLASLTGSVQGWGYVILTGLVCLAAYPLLRRFTAGPLGRTLRAIRDDENAAIAIGKNVVALRLVVQGVGGALAGLSGALLAGFIGGWSPSAWQYVETLALLTAIIVGGLGDDLGVLVGTVIIPVLILQGVQFLPQVNNHAQLTQDLGWIILGALTIAFIWLRPRGLIPERRPAGLVAAARLAGRSGTAPPAGAPPAAPSGGGPSLAGPSAGGLSAGGPSLVGSSVGGSSSGAPLAGPSASAPSSGGPSPGGPSPAGPPPAGAPPAGQPGGRVLEGGGRASQAAPLRPGDFLRVGTSLRGAAGQVLLAAEDLGKHYGGVRAVDGAALVISPGSITGLIGPNGAGKTTVLGIISGFVRPDSGRVWFDGQDVTRLPAYRRARRGLVRTFQLPHEFGRLTTIENLMAAAPGQRAETAAGILAGKPYWRSQDREILARAARLLDLFGMTDKADEPAARLSGGQKRMLEVMRALMVQPALLLLDEPMAGLSPALSDRLEQICLGLKAEGLSIVLVEHELGAVDRLCDHVVVMAQGRVLSEGTMAELRVSKEVQRAYVVG